VTRRDIFQRVINAEIVPMKPSDVQEAGDFYMQSWLTTAEVARLMQGDITAEMDVRNGRFLEDFFAPRVAQPSIAEQMKFDLSSAMNGYGRYYGYVLRAIDTRKMLGFITGRQALQPDEEINPFFLQRQERTLRDGVTGGGMRYTSATLPYELLSRDIPTTMEIDTVAGVPYAVSRLTAETASAVLDTVRTTRVNVYHMYGLSLDPPSPNVTTRIGENGKSDRMYSDLGGQQFGIDENPTAGPSVMHTVNGSMVAVRPTWSWKTAPADRFKERAQAKWQSQKRAMGHFWPDTEV
jgi:hypothetical protein